MPNIDCERYPVAMRGHGTKKKKENECLERIREELCHHYRVDHHDARSFEVAGVVRDEHRDAILTQLVHYLLVAILLLRPCRISDMRTDQVQECFPSAHTIISRSSHHHEFLVHGRNDLHIKKVLIDFKL